MKPQEMSDASRAQVVLQRAIELCGTCKDVREEVDRNFLDNQWWPRSIANPITRVLLAGLSTRVGYTAISSYRKVGRRLDGLSTEELLGLDEERFKLIVAPIGLQKGRWAYWVSLREFLRENEIGKLQELPNGQLIGMFRRHIHGVAYKVAQAMVVCLKGYYCGVCTIDSGMKDMFGPCLNMPISNGPRGHEDLRLLVEATVKQYGVDGALHIAWNPRIGAEIKHNGEGAAVWLAHLILVYFKRLYCNKARVRDCPLANDAAYRCRQTCLARKARRERR